MACETTEGMVRVVAGAGSGKTRVLAHRYAYLVNDLGISPSNVLCMTFTNKASQEMRYRISRMVDRGNVNDFICTIHGFCVKLLRREIYRIGYPKNFNIIDEEDAKVLAKQAMEEFGIDRKKTTAERFLRQVAGLKGYDPDAYIQQHILPNASTEAPDALVRYIRLQLKYYALDFDDLLYFTIYILEHFPEAKAYWTEKLNYIMVDEGQDCSADDWRLLFLLASHHHNLFVVGDPDQAIYEWRGAKPKLFVDFRADATVILNRNYRSTPEILGVANAIIANNHNRIPKDLFTQLPGGLLTTHYHAANEKEEGEFVASRIAEEVKQGASYSDFAVLYRSSFMSRILEQSFIQQKIPYTVWGGVKFFERREIKDVLSYLKVIDNPDDDVAFSRIINIPSRKFGKASMAELKSKAEQKGKSLYRTLAGSLDDGKFARPQLKAFVSAMESLRLRADMMTVSELTDTALETFEIKDLYRNDTEEERLENISELINSMKEYEKVHLEEDETGLRHYLQEISLYTDADINRKEKAVRTMTIHQAKGLEFPAVFVIGLSEGLFPNHRTIRERRKDGEEEERRLMYVAATRAMNRLYLSESEGHLNDSSGFKYPSRFFAEIPDTLIVHEGKWDPALMEGTRMMVKMLDEELAGDSGDKLAIGSRVIHKVFGAGTVKSYDRDSDSYTISFDSGATRTLLPRALTPC